VSRAGGIPVTHGGKDVKSVSHSTPRPGVGDRAPDFTLRHTFTERVTLADRWQRGPVVLAFYVFDFGSV
jgi:hypothetical protein